MLIEMETRRFGEKEFPNGDFYSGEFKGELPHGRGSYVWTDGTIYEGVWEEGKISGKGKLTWSAGAKYEGDFSGGYLHGFGTLTSPDGSVYSGSWRMNVRHGLGRKEYSNSDIYNGSWKEGLQDGSGSYSWNNGNRYIGNWKKGKMYGRGVMRWANGDLFDGFWVNGSRHGSGVYKFADGGLYFGTWTRGLKDGKGIFYPAGSKHPSLKKWCQSFGYDDTGNFLLSRSSSINVEEVRHSKTITRSLSENPPINGTMRNSHRRLSDRFLDENWSLCDPTRDFVCHGPSNKSIHTSDSGQSEGQDKNRIVYEREYMQGVLIRERVISSDNMSHKANPPSHQKEIGTSTCMAFLGGKQSYYLMLNLQLGIRYTVGKITPVPRREVRASDFGDRARIRMFFPREGSQFTPPHKSIDFYWKDYCPMVFRNLREMFKLDAAEYMMSICGDDGLREISSPGKSGSIFYLSHDDRFVIKTLKKSELKVLLRMLPKYYDHVGDHENTLITKFFGVHRIKLKWGKKVRFVVMGNMFCTELKIHRRYDLKGSTQGRFTDKSKIEEKTTLKDLDLAYEFHMDKLLREALFKQIYLDCSFLESLQIIDYSLLLGLHFRAPEQLNDILEPPNSLSDQDSIASVDAGSSQELSIPPKGLLLVTHEPSSVNTAPGPHIRGSTLRAFSVGEREVDLILPGTARLRVQLGVNMPAQAHHKLLQDNEETARIELFEVYDVVIYMGIIDILQEYNMKKKVEHTCKSLQYDPMTISAIEPELYSKRFIDFLVKVFPEEA
ncbi:PREDICTED: phosphatidylinositol 4-phosphate 5-kinase 7 [Tarenaya hassleriana]|uniref:phosphatidylinositol 4-phosphate 5-kinase 7 n=1 Tax=Tarenaya hassleriana TaxID=28532 RepID=UPI00053C6056|nr:PREDICTED: phosphatidylinositol 4-phosphate 5-kinase 7 [Tarenaya hassleriana]XP_010533936.1 PREDICTED: phosphatidylinositol 4-phosphate 5-kinase 7 [Tarenaya hassleriana]